MKDTAIFGCGHIDRADDAAGILAIRELATHTPRGVQVHEVGGDPLRLLELWPGVRHAIVIDAVFTGGPAGTVHRFTSPNLELGQERFPTSTHGISLRETIQLALITRRMPRQLTIIAIEGQNFQAGAEISIEVRRGIAEVVETLRSELTSG